ncbi:MAG: glycine dehydrogenase [Actinomycetota bacterium]|nr:glycine dehydrogenase [Actinomycetota bacterium]
MPLSANISPFLARHLGPDAAAIRRMLATIGCDTPDDLIAGALPAAIRDEVPLDLPAPVDEDEVLARLRDLADRNTVAVPMLGLGYHGTRTPAVIRRNVLENPAWYTAYTPYQPEISQGRLEALLTFQTMVADLTGLPTANASLLDEATAAAEAVALMRRARRSVPRGVLLVDRRVLPQTIAVIGTRAEPIGLEVIVTDLLGASAAERERGHCSGRIVEAAAGRPVLGVLVQYPGRDGEVFDLRGITEAAHGAGALVTVAADLLALALLSPPGHAGADIAVGTTQRFGVPLGYGGPHAAYLAVRAGLERSVPGRLVGVSRDAEGRPALRLALQTREQHIRRERATSNICTSQALLAVLAALYAVYHGPQGLRRIAADVSRRAAGLAEDLESAGHRVVHREFFDTVLVRVPERALRVVAAAEARGILLRAVDADHVAVTCDETTTDDHLLAVRAAFAEAGAPGTPHRDASGDERGDAPGDLPAAAGDGPPRRTGALPPDLLRTDEYLTAPVFHEHRSETAMLRHLRRLADADYALDRGMIPLGSCTMKLTAAAAMEPITWPAFADLHPFAPASHAAGTLRLVADLERDLAEITGYDAVSLQPNAGSQGELAGLLAIRAHHRDTGQPGRDLCLVPASAHGTNAASAALAGFEVLVVECDRRGDIDRGHLRTLLERHSDRIAVAMITYPSTHGVYEEGIGEVCDLVHAAGGQVYVDGANLNALVGLARPGRFGADVSHLNLHKTFSIPHGGGGPGVGPLAVRAHLAPHLPGHPLHPDRDRSGGGGPVSAAPYGSAGILPIAWAYLRLMGPQGLRTATVTAVLAANYLAARLREHYPVLYTGPGGFVAHECLLDLRPLTRETGITVDDVAKRLIDHGFHAPTMSFPVPGTLMVEPTESEDLPELDRFCEAMIHIRGEADAVAAGQWPADDNPLVKAPHTAESLVGEWTHPYTRARAVYPGRVDPRHKYWPCVARVDNVLGDRHPVFVL